MKYLNRRFFLLKVGFCPILLSFSLGLPVFYFLDEKTLAPVLKNTFGGYQVLFKLTMLSEPSEITKFWDINKMKELNHKFSKDGRLLKVYHQGLLLHRYSFFVFNSKSDYISWEKELKNQRAYNDSKMESLGFRCKTIFLSST